MAITNSPDKTAGPSEVTSAVSCPRWRRYVAVALIVASCICAPLSLSAIWLRNQVLDTDSYVETVAPLSQEPAIIDALAADITNELFDIVDVEKEIKSALPDRAKFVSGAMTAGVRRLTENLARRALETDQFQQAWLVANRLAHEQLKTALTGGGKIVATENGKVVLDLSAVFEQVRQQLVERAVGVFPKALVKQLQLQFTIFELERLGSAQKVVRLLDASSLWLPVLTLTFFVGGVALSPNRRRALVGWGIGSAFALAFLGAMIGLVRPVYLDAITSDSMPRDAAEVTFDTMVRYLRQSLRFVIAFGLVVAIGSWLTGPGRIASKVRNTFSEAFGGLGDRAESHGWTFGGFGRFVAAHINAFRVVGIGIVLLELLVVEHNTVGRLLLLTLLLAVYVGVLQFIARAAKLDIETAAVTAE